VDPNNADVLLISNEFAYDSNSVCRDLGKVTGGGKKISKFKKQIPNGWLLMRGIFCANCMQMKKGLKL